MTPRTLLNSLGLRLPSQNLFDGNQMRRTDSVHHFCKTSFFKNLQILPFLLKNPPNWLWETTKMKKSPPPHTCDPKNRFTRRTATPFNSADT